MTFAEYLRILYYEELNEYYLDLYWRIQAWIERIYPPTRRGA